MYYHCIKVFKTSDALQTSLHGVPKIRNNYTLHTNGVPTTQSQMTNPEDFIQTPETISERAGERKIRLRERAGWPYFGASELFADLRGDDLVFRGMDAPLDDSDLVCMPKRPCDVYEFETQGGEILTWYARSNLVAWRGLLYAVFYEINNMLRSYAWLTATDACATLVRNSGLKCVFLRDGELHITGLHVHRCTGEIVRWIRASGASEPGWAGVHCMRMRSPEPWYTRGFVLERLPKYLRNDLLNRGQIRKLQDWMREKGGVLRSKRELQLRRLRSVGWFSILTDDIFELIARMVLSISKHRHRTERDLAYLCDYAQETR